ncbi:hypothetical protein CDAR_61231 [Caerostris darwini]|uniref:Uncharacterized protein n=1 Tax=Caerostris darwini TaxID=1538125 RepID=A0AAV4V2N7_9ARAC|nr:hypothetical protein CDAR_61231 [Caerostris darwini]
MYHRSKYRIFRLVKLSSSIKQLSHLKAIPPSRTFPKAQSGLSFINSPTKTTTRCLSECHPKVALYNSGREIICKRGSKLLARESLTAMFPTGNPRLNEVISFSKRF